MTQKETILQIQSDIYTDNYILSVLKWLVAAGGSPEIIQNLIKNCI